MATDYKIEDGKPVIYLFGRGRSRLRLTFKKRDYVPYFYAPSDDGTPDAFNRPVKRVEVTKPSEVRAVRKNFEFTDEADILFPWRFLIDRKIKCGFTVYYGQIIPCGEIGIPPRVLYFDIEASSPPEVLPRPERPDYPVVAISCFDSYTSNTTVFTVGIDQYEPYQIACSSEREMFSRFVGFVRDLSPDVLTGWNCELWDLPYLYERCRKLHIDLSGISPLGWVSWRRNPQERRSEFHISGREVIDLLTAFRKWHKPLGELETYDFKYITQLFTGFDYIDYGDRIDELLRYDPHELVKYCWNDANALNRLDNTLGIIRFYDHLRRFVGCSLRSALDNSKLIDYLILRMRTQPLPTKPFFEKVDTIRGALVFEPPVGLHEGVANFDIRSIYPNLIIHHNISPDGRKTGREGVLTRAVKYITSERERLRELLRTHPDDVRLQAEATTLKFIQCSFYGVMQYPNFRLYDSELAGEITRRGRELIQKLASHCHTKGWRVLYGDTDSLFVKMSFDEAEAFENPLENVEIRFERYFDTILFKPKIGERVGAKKRYAGRVIWEDGKTTDSLRLVGFEPKRSDSAEITRSTMREFFRLITSRRISEGFKLLRDTVQTIRTQPIVRLGIPKGLHKPSYEVDNPWMRGVQYSRNRFGWRFREDQKPLLLYVRRANPPTDVICITHDITSLPEDVEIDWKVMVEKLFERKFSPVLEALGTTWEIVVSGQTTLTG